MSKLQQSFNSATSSCSRMSTNDLINKIIALEDTLYSANLQSQQLRQKRNKLQRQLQLKKAQLFGSAAQIKPIFATKLSRNSSLRLVNLQDYNVSDSVSATQSPGVTSIQPRMGTLITGNQPNFQALKLGETQGSLQQSKVSTISSPRTVGIRKNLKKIVKVDYSQESVDMDFKSIEQLWNGKKGESFLKKTSEKPSYKKKKTYLS